MLSSPPRTWRFCDGLHRREFLRVGALTGLGLSLPMAFAARAQADPGRSRPRPAKAPTG